MLTSIKRRLSSAPERDGGFTLIELAVVILIIGILLAIAIPTFLGIRRNAQNKAAQSALRTVLVAAKAHASDTGGYGPTGDEVTKVADIQLSESSITISGAASTDAKVISALADTDGNLILNAKAQNNVCFVIIDNLSDTSSGTRYGVKQGAAGCTASASDTAIGSLSPNQKTGWKV